jgi:hypothetical protein
MRLLGKAALFCVAILGASPCAFAHLFDKARESTVYIFFDVTDPATGEKRSVHGTGFVVSQRGYVLTASYLLRDWAKQSVRDKESNPIKATLRDGPLFASGNALNLQIVKMSDPDSEDIALMKLPDLDMPGGYSPAPICFSARQEAAMGYDFFAFGFPLDQSFQPMRGTLGTRNAPGGRWAAVSEFAEGMSGAPVYDLSGNVIGLVKGGLANTAAVQWITPILHGENQLKLAGVNQQCETDWMTSIQKPSITPFETRLVMPILIKVFDSQSDAPIPYATITIAKARSGALIAKGNTDENGSFKFSFSEKIATEK